MSYKDIIFFAELMYSMTYSKGVMQIVIPGNYMWVKINTLCCLRYKPLVLMNTLCVGQKCTSYMASSKKL